MISISPSAQEKVWLDKSRYDAAERRYYERLAQSSELGKVSIISDSSDHQECAGVDQEKEIENDPNSCQNAVSEQKTPPKSPKGSKIDQKDAVKPKGKEVLPNKDAVNSHKVEENVCIKQGTEISNVVQPPKPDVCVLSPQTDKESNKTIEKNKETGNEVCTLLKSKEEVCSKTEKTKKSEDQNKITNSSKADMNTHKKVESGDITCPKVKGQAKPKAVDDKLVNKEIVNEKVNSGIDTASEIIKGVSQNSNSWNSLAGEVAKARQHIKNSLQCIDDIAVTSNTVSVEITNRINALEKENVELKTQVNQLTELLKKMDLRISSMEKSNASSSKPDNKAPAPHVKKDDAEDDDGVDLFGSDSEDEDTEAAKIKEQRLAEYAARKAKKPVLIAKSNIILDVKPWDDETDMKQLEAEVRKISTDGLVWGASKLVPLAYGIHKLQISCVVEDDKVSVDWLQETIEEITDYVQSVDIAAFNKV